MIVKIWLPPAADHAAWQELCAESMSREDLEARVAETCAAAAEAGHEAEVVACTVDEIRCRLGDRPSTPGNRAAAIIKSGTRLGITIRVIPGMRSQVIGWALLSGARATRGERPIGAGGVGSAVRELLAELEEKP